MPVIQLLPLEGLVIIRKAANVKASHPVEVIDAHLSLAALVLVIHNGGPVDELPVVAILPARRPMEIDLYDFKERILEEGGVTLRVHVVPENDDQVQLFEDVEEGDFHEAVVGVFGRVAH